VMGVVSGDALTGDGLELVVLRSRLDDQRREQLLEHVAVLPEEKAEELEGVVGDQVELEFRLVLCRLDRFRTNVESDDLPDRQNMTAPQVVIGIGRGEAVEVRPADRGEDQRVGMIADFAPEPGERIDGDDLVHSKSLTRSSPD